MQLTAKNENFYIVQMNLLDDFSQPIYCDYPICPLTAISSYSNFNASMLFKARVDTWEARILCMSMWSGIILQIHALWDRRSAQRVILSVIQVTFVDT